MISFIQKKVSSTASHLWIQERKNTNHLCLLQKNSEQGIGSRRNQKVSVPNLSFLYPKTSPTALFLFCFFGTSMDFPLPPSGNIHRCAKPPLTATLAEAKNEIYTWLPPSTMCNHHLIGKWSRVQTGKGKAWLKPTQPRAGDPPHYGNEAQAELGGAGALHRSTALTDPDRTEKGQGRFFHWGWGWWLPQYINFLRKTKQVLKIRSH